MMVVPIRWPWQRPERLQLDRAVEATTAAALATVDVELANLRAVLLDIDETVIDVERGEHLRSERHAGE